MQWGRLWSHRWSASIGQLWTYIHLEIFRCRNRGRCLLRKQTLHSLDTFKLSLDWRFRIMFRTRKVRRFSPKWEKMLPKMFASCQKHEAPPLSYIHTHNPDVQHSSQLLCQIVMVTWPQNPLHHFSASFSLSLSFLLSLSLCIPLLLSSTSIHKHCLIFDQIEQSNISSLNREKK